MKRLVLMLFVFAVFGYAESGFFIPSGMINNVKYVGGACPGKVDFQKMKQGESERVDYFGWFSFGDAGVAAAARQGGLTQVVCYEQKFVSAAGMSKFRTIAYGY